MTKKKARTDLQPPPFSDGPAGPTPAPDDPLKRNDSTEPSPERAKQMAEARIQALRKLGRIKDE